MLFAISIAVRYSNLKAPSERREEWQTGHVLTTLSIWEQNGITNHYFSPVWTFNNSPDKLTNSLGGIKDKNNFTYYVSYPPFSFILPYFIFKLSGKAISVGEIRLFSLLLHFICALLIFLIVYKFFSKHINNDFFIPGFIAYCFYVFANGNLWFHSNFYFADSLVQVFVLSLVYLLMFILEQPDKNSKTKNLLLFVVTFLGVYTEWLALLLAFVISVFLIFKSFKIKPYLNYFFAIATASFLSLCLSIYQYSQIAGFNSLKNYSIAKFSGRSGFNEQTAIDGTSIYHQQSYKTIYSNYITNYNYLGNFTLLCLFAFLILVFVNLKTKKVKFKIPPALILSLISISVILHHVVFFNFTAIHDISTLKTSMPVCLFIGYFFGILYEYAGSISKNLSSGFAVLFCSCFIFYSSQEYLQLYSGYNDSHFQRQTGDAVARFAKSDELVFTNVGISPVLMWRAQRNLLPVKNIKDCIKVLDSLHYNKAVFFKISTLNSKFLLKITKLNANGDTLALN